MNNQLLFPLAMPDTPNIVHTLVVCISIQNLRIRRGFVEKQLYFIHKLVIAT